MGEARTSQSAFFLPRTERINEGTNYIESTRQPKRTREELEIPTIIVDGLNGNTVQPRSVPAAAATSSLETADAIVAKNRTAVKHDRLLDKIDRYTSHNEFLRRCIGGAVTPISYKIELEPSIGNHDDTFLKGYYDLLDNFSKQVMKYTADYCLQQISDFEAQKTLSEQELESTTTSETLGILKKAFEVNHNKRIKTLREVKDKKFIRLKYRNQQQIRRPTYAGAPNNGQETRVPQTGRISRRNSNTNIGRQGPSRKTSRTHLAPDVNSGKQMNDFEYKVKDLERQIIELRQINTQKPSGSYSEAVKSNDKNTTRNSVPKVIDNTRTINTQPSIQQKNEDPSHSAQRGETNNNGAQYNDNNLNSIEITEVLDYISTAMQTLGGFEKRFRKHLSIPPTQPATL